MFLFLRWAQARSYWIRRSSTRFESRFWREACRIRGRSRSFPMEDATHQRMAISGATRSANAGNISQDEAARIKAEARRKLAGAMMGRK